MNAGISRGGGEGRGGGGQTREDLRGLLGGRAFLDYGKGWPRFGAGEGAVR